MFYTTDKRAPLPHNPFNALVVPRPIGWISTLDAEGRANLAPYSFFNAVSYVPPQVIFSGGARPERQGGPGFVKDSVANARATGEFVFNLVTRALVERMNATSAECPPGVDEFALGGLTKAPSVLVKPPRVAESPVHFECRVVDVIATKARPGRAPNELVLGEVVGIHIDERVLTDGVVDYRKLDPVARLGAYDYAALGEIFAIARPGGAKD
jgi:flavin reductase (DIM6/NTAB) family NADH-FMN oxidoreductase RutF